MICSMVTQLPWQPESKIVFFCFPLLNLRFFLMEEVKHDFEIIPLEVIESLIRLKVFRFIRRNKVGVYYEGEKALLEKLDFLPELEELCIDLRTISGMQKLLESAKLRDCSCQIRLCSIEDSLEMASLLASWSRLKHLESIALLWQDNIMEGSSITDTYHLSKLCRVDIKRCNSITHLTWLRCAPNLEFLKIVFRNSIKEVVKGLEDDDDGDADAVTDRGNTNDVFPNLKRLLFFGLPKLKSIHKRPLAFPSLKYIYIVSCPNLKKLPLNSNSAKDILISIEGHPDWWDTLEWEGDTAIKDLHPKFRKVPWFRIKVYFLNANLDHGGLYWLAFFFF